MLWIGMIIGIFLGANLGVIILTLCVSAKQGDRMIDSSLDLR